MAKQIVLVNGYRVGRPVLPTGIGYVAQAIENAGFVCHVCDTNLQTLDEIVQVVVERKPKYVGCGTMTYEVERNYELLQAIRDAVPDVVIVLGGPHAIAAQREIFEECHSVDIVIQGEGEEALVKLLQGVPWHIIPGVLVRDSEIEAIPYQFLDIDNVAFPTYNNFDLEKYGTTMSIASSRGCVYNCSFCGGPKFLGKRWRAFKLDRMVEEFEYWYARGYRRFYFSDSLLTLDKKRIIGFCTHVIESGYSRLEFVADGLRADHLDLEVLQHMKKANFQSITLGVESVNDETLEFFNKGESFDQIDRAISIADSLDFDISLYLIIGAPEEKYQDALRSINYPARYKNITSSIFSKLMPIKGTSYYDYAVEHDLVKDKSLCYPKHEAHGTNERFDTNNPVEEIWNSLLPEIDKMSRFLEMRKQIKATLARLGLKRIDVETLNALTRISLNPVVFVLLGGSSRIANGFDLLISKGLTVLRKLWGKT